MKNILSVRPLEERDEAPAIQKRGRGWLISKERLDAVHEQVRIARLRPTEAQKLLGISLEGSVG